MYIHLEHSIMESMILLGPHDVQQNPQKDIVCPTANSKYIYASKIYCKNSNL